MSGTAWRVEKLCGIEVPPRAQYIRVIASELSRISDHFTCIGAGALETGGDDAVSLCAAGARAHYDVHELLCGARVTTNFVRIGGLQSDLQAGFADACRSKIKAALAIFADVDKLLHGEPIFPASGWREPGGCRRSV